MKNHLIKKTIFLVFILPLFNCPVQAAQVDYSRANQTGILFKLPIGAKYVSLGSGQAASAQGLEAMAVNPAGLTQAHVHEIFADYASLYEELGAATVGYNYNADWLAIGLMVSHIQYGSFERFDLDSYGNPIRTNESLTPYGLLGQLSFAKALSPFFSVGVNTKFLQDYLIDKTYYFLAWDLGLQVRTGLPGFRTGLVVKNLGRKFTDFSLPFATQLSFSYQLPLNLFQQDQLSITVDGILPHDQPLKGVLGLEYSLLNHVSLRAGYHTSEARFSENAFTGLSFGLGLAVDKYTMDYAYTPNSTIGDGHWITLRASFGPRPSWEVESVAGQKQRQGKKKEKRRYLYEYIK